MDILDAPLFPVFAVDDIVAGSFLSKVSSFSNILVIKHDFNLPFELVLFESVISVYSFVCCVLSTILSEVFKLPELCNGMTNDVSKLDDDDFSISASKSIIKSPIPEERQIKISHLSAAKIYV